MWTIMMFIVIGMVAGWLASVLVRGEKNPSDWGLLFGVGVGGSLVGGIVVNILAGNGFMVRPAGLIGSVVFACLLLWLVGSTRKPARSRSKRR